MTDEALLQLAILLADFRDKESDDGDEWESRDWLLLEVHSALEERGVAVPPTPYEENPFG